MNVVWRATSPNLLATTLPSPTASGVYWQADVTTFLMEVPQIARFQATAGVVEYACLGNLGEAAVRMFGAGLPAAAAWVQQGYFALHAASVATPSGAIVLAGPSTAGKSVLAAALTQRGYPVVADEVTPLSMSDKGSLTMQSTTDCDIMLWQDAVTKLELDETDHMPLRPGLPRFIVRGLGTACTAPRTMAVRAVYLLGNHNDPTVQRKRLDGSQRVLAIIGAAFNRYLPQAQDQRQRAFLQLAPKLVNVPVYRLLRPRRGWSASACADRILEDFAL